jgi:hypothetical protein
MSNTTPPNTNQVILQPWFDYFWKVAVTVLAIGLASLFYRMYKFWLKEKRQRAAIVARDPNMMVTNRQAIVLWGNNPGVVVAGIKGDNIYRDADGRGSFGITPPSSKIPELQDFAATAKPAQHLVVAVRAGESTISPDDIIIEALPYEDIEREDLKHSLV